VEYSATGVSLTALTERVHSDGATPPGWKYFLLMWALFSVAAIAALWWSNWYLHCCCVSARGALDAAPIVWLNSDCITLG